MDDTPCNQGPAPRRFLVGVRVLQETAIVVAATDRGSALEAAAEYEAHLKDGRGGFFPHEADEAEFHVLGPASPEARVDWPEVPPDEEVQDEAPAATLRLRGSATPDEAVETAFRIRRLRAELEMLEKGHLFAGLCPDCGAAIAGCDFRLNDLTTCGQPAIKWVPNGADETIYFCEDHGDIPTWLEDMRIIGQWAAYRPGREECGCGYPY